MTDRQAPYQQLGEENANRGTGWDAGRADAYQAILDKAWAGQIPYKILWELTYRCNERCIHCYLVDRDGRGELTTEEARRILDELAKAGSLFLTLTGGEALLRSDFFEIATYARQQGFALRLLTNGTLITPEVADRLKALRPTSVEISLYGVRPETHDAVTQLPGSHERSLRALRLLHERGVRVHVKGPLMERNAEQFDELRALAEGLGGLFAFNPSLTLADDGSDGPLAEGMRPETMEAFFAQHLEGWGYREPAPEANPCNAGINTATIDPYGNVRPCRRFQTRAGNLREQKFDQIWRESPVLQELRAVTNSQLEACAACELRPTCVRCPATAHLETGELRGCSQIARAEARARRAALEAKGQRPTPDGPRTACDEG